ncbi:MAG: J domain-containing protein [Armatimonadetes bacterium]|nr:J domain-containing protein [Anaerolineae bacterium]
MGMIRHATYYSGDYLVTGMWQAGVIAQMLHDGGDIILFEKATGERVSVHLIESSIELYEIRKILEANTEDGIYTVFMLWTTMMVPTQGRLFKLTEWMAGFLALNGGFTYAYDIIHEEVYIFPVFLRGEGDVRLTEYGLTIDIGKLTCRTMHTSLPGLSDTWKVADFVGTGEADPSHVPPPLAAPDERELNPYYVILGVMPGDDLETIKQAYRALARITHPDANPAPDATEQMQRLNDAYDRVLAALEGELE